MAPGRSRGRNRQGAWPGLKEQWRIADPRRGNVWDDGDVGLVLVAPENVYLETVFLRRLHLLVSFCIQIVSYQQLA